MNHPFRALRSRLEQVAREEVERLTHSLPHHLYEKCRRVPVILEWRPSMELVQEGLASDTLGLFVGQDLLESEDPLPPHILLFLANLWDEAGKSLPRFRQEVRKTFLHELGHYLGLNENDLAQRDLD